MTEKISVCFYAHSVASELEVRVRDERSDKLANEQSPSCGQLR